MAKRKETTSSLSPLESAVMQVVWKKGEVRAEDVRLALEAKNDLKDSTVRTLLRRLEAKGVVEHSRDGRAFTYSAKIQPQHLAARDVGTIVDRFCKGSVSSLVLGMAEDAMISPAELRELADRIENARAADQETGRKKRTKKRKSD